MCACACAGVATEWLQKHFRDALLCRGAEKNGAMVGKIIEV